MANLSISSLKMSHDIIRIMILYRLTTLLGWYGVLDQFKLETLELNTISKLLIRLDFGIEYGSTLIKTIEI